MSDYRAIFFQHNPGTKLLGRRGTWYRCVGCGRWFSKSEITVDHRIPKRNGGTDDYWNLQPMCRSCNSSKRDRQSNTETMSTLIRATAHGQLGRAAGSMAKQKVKDALGIKYVRK
jgi:5-methylcytosine-specific restriction endonuclease McrA